ncbi:MAG TPA: GNAT family N-acetyltransferase, partial [Burkholderiales bacterium]|nr:GNAT family N-acetyltransferase [Burkholderiales bacterium]
MLATLLPPAPRMSAPARPETRRIRTVRLEGWQDIPDLDNAWSALLQRARAGSVFQTLAWQMCWWRAFGAPHELLVVLAFSGPRLVGVAPMMVYRSGPFGAGSIRFIGSPNHASDFCDFIVDPDVPEALDALLENICGAAHQFSRIDLSHFPGHSQNLHRALDYFARRGLKACADFEMDAPVRVLGDRQADLKAAGKTSLKRHVAFFRKSGDLRFHRCTRMEEILGYLGEFFEQHKARWGRTSTPSQFGDPAQRRFYEDLVRELFPRGWLRFDVVLFNGQPLAFHFGFEYRRSFIYYKSTFDTRFAFKAPGEVMLKFLLDAAIEDKLDEFDFTVGSESYKYRFANRVRNVNRVLAFKSAHAYWLNRAAHNGKARLKRLLGRARTRPPAGPLPAGVPAGSEPQVVRGVSP